MRKRRAKGDNEMCSIERSRARAQKVRREAEEGWRRLSARSSVHPPIHLCVRACVRACVRGRSRGAHPHTHQPANQPAHQPRTMRQVGRANCVLKYSYFHFCLRTSCSSSSSSCAASALWSFFMMVVAHSPRTTPSEHSRVLSAGSCPLPRWLQTEFWRWPSDVSPGPMPSDCAWTAAVVDGRVAHDTYNFHHGRPRYSGGQIW